MAVCSSHDRSNRNDRRCHRNRKRQKCINPDIQTAEKIVRERDASMIVLDHGQAVGVAASATASDDDAYYAQFKVPDDLVW